MLIVEDNTDHALLLRMAAERIVAGLEVRIARDGLEAVAYLEGRKPFEDREAHPAPGLVILDLVMPRLDGFGVLEWVRASEEYRHLPVVVLTSSISPRDEARAFELGASDFHTKPADLGALEARLREILERWLT